jgi:hypothetical protein
MSNKQKIQNAYENIQKQIDLIARKRQIIAFHSSFNEPDILAIEQYTGLLDNYEKQLDSMLRQF